MTSKHDKARSLILAALMVFSVFAGTVAISGTAVADHGNTEDDQLSDNSTFWQGQELFSDTGNASATYTVRTTDGDFVKQVKTDSAGHLTIDSSDIGAGTYNLHHEDGSVAVSNFEIVEQSLSASFSSDSIENNQNGTLVLNSNRGSYNMTVSATRNGNDVSEDTLANIFDGAGDVGDGDGAVTLQGSSNADINANFNGVESGNYTFTVSAADTTASDTTSIDVKDAAAGDVGFTQSTFEVAQGDVADVTVEFTGDASKATIVIGEESESGYEATVNVTDNDGDGEVTLRFNTYDAGNGVSVDAEGDEDSANLVSETDGLSNILEQGDYGLAVKMGHTTDNSTVLNSPDDVGTLYINERSTDSASVWTAPGSASDVTDAPLTDDSSIAQGDWVVVEFQASGLAGLVESSGGLSAVDSGNLSLSVTQTEASTPKNTDPKELNLSGAGVQVWDEADNGTYFVAIDTSAQSIEAGEEYNASLTVSDDRLVDENESVSSTFEVTEGEVVLDGPVNVTATEGQNISGTSTYAPGTEFQVQIESTGDTQPRFFESATATVQDDGTWAVSFDRFAEQSAGDTFKVTAKAPEGDVTADGNVVEETTETTTGTTETTTTETTTDGTPTASPTEGQDEGTPTPSEEPTDTTTPGFGVAVALVALLAAALLAVRRD